MAGTAADAPDAWGIWSMYHSTFRAYTKEEETEAAAAEAARARGDVRAMSIVGASYQFDLGYWKALKDVEDKLNADNPAPTMPLKHKVCTRCFGKLKKFYTLKPMQSKQAKKSTRAVMLKLKL